MPWFVSVHVSESIRVGGQTRTRVATLISELKQVTFLTTRTSTGSKVDVFHQSQPLTQSSDVTHAVRVVKNVTCLNSLLTLVSSHPSSLDVKDDVHSVLRISSAHNKGGPPDINIAQILHLSNFFELKRTVYIHLQV